MKRKRKLSLAALRPCFSYLKRYRFLILLTLLLSVLYVACTLCIPLLIGEAIDLMIGEGKIDLAAVGSYLTKAVLLAVLGGLSLWVQSVINQRITYHVCRDMRRDGFEKIHRLPIAYLDTHPSGDIVSRLIADIEQYSEGLLLGFTQLFTGIVTILSTLVFMMVLNPVIALVVALLTPFSLILAAFIAKRTHRFFAEQARLRGEQTDYINEMVENIKTVKAFSSEEKVISEFRKINDRLEKSSLSAIFFSSLINPTTRVINAIVYAAVAGVGAFFAAGIFGGSALAITVGELSAFLAYVNQYTKPFNEISGVVAEFQNALACAERFFDFLSQKEESPDPSDAVVLDEARGEIVLNDVSFSYLPERPLMEHLSLRIRAGEKVGIVGPTGCGKTTLINLLLRFYDVNDGSITVDGHDLRNITRHSLRRNYGMVLQETWLAAATVRENLKMGRPDASDEEMIDAAKRVHCHGFICRMEKGYDTVIGENGGELSGGQKQLLCIARAMIADPPILILDEATSSIDTRTELRVQRAMRRLTEGRTSFVVAHRLSTIREMDRILVMKDGTIIEEGTHTELLARGGFYAELFHSQFAES